jgi:predicted ATP-grasp superfamily ATP-dependent carboligase
MTKPAALLLVAISARALAAAARRAGFMAVAIDAFGDEDTRAACDIWERVEDAMEGFAKVELEPIVSRLRRTCEPVGLVYGSGFDDCANRLMEIAQAPLLGASPEALARTKDPQAFARSCEAAGISHPEIRFTAPELPARWLIKRRGGSGGAHIAHGGARSAKPGEYWQRRVEGRTISLLFVRDAAGLTPVAWSEQWTAPCASAPFRYAGAAGPLDMEAPKGLLSSLAALTGALGLRGLASADFLDDGERFWLLEINPRPGATLDVFDDEEDPLLARHVAAVMGRPAAPLKPRSPRAAQIVYAETDSTTPKGDWPDWAADRAAPGTPVPAGAPFCTVFADGASVRDAKTLGEERSRRIQSWLQGTSPWARRV